jgi:DNA-binding transcriptional ArsR family regulator
LQRSDISQAGNDEEFRRLLWFLLGGSRGGENRAKILAAIKSRPSNLNQLAKLIGVDYRSVQHHMTVLQKNNLVLSSGERYGVVFSVHPYLNYHFETFQQVCAQLGYVSNMTRESIDSALTRRKAMTQISLASDALHL